MPVGRARPGPVNLRSTDQEQGPSTNFSRAAGLGLAWPTSNSRCLLWPPEGLAKLLNSGRLSFCCARLPVSWQGPGVWQEAKD